MYRITFTQRGAVTSVFIFIIVIVLTLLAIVVASLATSGIHDSREQNFHNQALFLGESALERARFKFNNGDTCATVADGAAITFADGTLQIVSAIADVPLAGDCQLKVRGSMNNIVVLLTASFRDFGGTDWRVVTWDETDN